MKTLDEKCIERLITGAHKYRNTSVYIVKPIAVALKYKSVNMLIKQFITVAQRYKSTNELEIKPIVVAQRYRGNGLFMLTTAALVKKPSQELIPLKIFRSSMIDKEVHVIGAIRS